MKSFTDEKNRSLISELNSNNRCFHVFKRLAFLPIVRTTKQMCYFLCPYFAVLQSIGCWASATYERGSLCTTNERSISDLMGAKFSWIFFSSIQHQTIKSTFFHCDKSLCGRLPLIHLIGKQWTDGALFSLHRNNTIFEDLKLCFNSPIVIEIFISPGLI